jgi:hypothetical protein
MPTLNSPSYVTDWLKYEGDSYFSRDTAIIASGAGRLPSGRVIAQVTATGKYVEAAASGSDGSQTATAVLLFPVDATTADAQAVIVARHAIASHAGLTYGSTINDATKRAAANAQLKARGILVREGA